jgi:hypothetical protein
MLAARRHPRNLVRLTGPGLEIGIDPLIPMFLRRKEMQLKAMGREHCLGVPCEFDIQGGIQISESFLTRDGCHA